jgi:hypothetical protein
MCFKKIISPFNVFLQFLFLFKEALATTLTKKNWKKDDFYENGQTV